MLLFLMALICSIGAWLVVSKDSPHVVLRCNAAFTALSGLSMNDVLGLPLKATAMFGEKTENSAYEEFLSSLEDTNARSPCHCLLTLYHSIMVAGTIKLQQPSIYSLHVFPVFKRTVSQMGKSDSESKFTEAGEEIPAGSILIPQEDSTHVGEHGNLSYVASSPPMKTMQQIKSVE